MLSEVLHGLHGGAGKHEYRVVEASASGCHQFGQATARFGGGRCPRLPPTWPSQSSSTHLTRHARHARVRSQRLQVHARQGHRHAALAVPIEEDRRGVLVPQHLHHRIARPSAVEQLGLGPRDSVIWRRVDLTVPGNPSSAEVFAGAVGAQGGRGGGACREVRVDVLEARGVGEDQRLLPRPARDAALYLRVRQRPHLHPPAPAAHRRHPPPTAASAAQLPHAQAGSQSAS